jgi:hypothetical protein
MMLGQMYRQGSNSAATHAGIAQRNRAAAPGAKRHHHTHLLPQLLVLPARRLQLAPDGHQLLMCVHQLRLQLVHLARGSGR